MNGSTTQASVSSAKLKLYHRRVRSAAATAAALVALTLTQFTSAQITFDGTVGPADPVGFGGPDYAILQSYGTTTTSDGITNLFHSFGEFNVNIGESALFSGDSAITNIISRVTGGNPSLIDGTISSSIDGANFWFVNPAGLMINSNAVFDISGSLALGSADYIEFANSERFYALTPPGGEVSTLSVASPTDFGFVDATIAGSLTMNGVLLAPADGKGANLTAPSLTIDGGEIALINTGGESGADLHIRGTQTVDLLNQVNLTSTASGSGNGSSIFISGSEINLRTPDPGMLGSLDPGVSIATSTIGAGDAGSITFADAQLVTSNFDLDTGFNINAPRVSITSSSDTISSGAAGSISFTSGGVPAGGLGIPSLEEIPRPDTIGLGFSNTSIRTSTSSDNVANSEGSITFDVAGGLALVNPEFGTSIGTSTFGMSDAGDVTINGDYFALRGGSILNESGAGNTGAAGSVVINGTDGVGVAFADITTEIQSDLRSNDATRLAISGDRIHLFAADLTAQTSGSSDAGSIELSGEHVLIDSFVSLFAASGLGNTGAAGSVLINGTQSVEMTNSFVTTESMSALRSENQDSGSITIQGATIRLAGPQLIARTLGPSDAGDIRVDGTGDVFLVDQTNLFAESGGGETGAPGDILIRGEYIETQDAIFTAATSSDLNHPASRIEISADERLMVLNGFVTATTSGVSNAGDISLSGDQVYLFNRASVGADTSGAGAAGNLSITGENWVELNGTTLSTTTSSNVENDLNSGRIDITSGGGLLAYAFITAETQGADSAGDIAIQAQRIAVQPGSTITARTSGAGSAGSVTVTGTGLDGISVTTNETQITSESLTSSSGSAGSVTIDGRGAAIQLVKTVISATTQSDVEALDDERGSISLMTSGGELTLTETSVLASTAGASPAGSILIQGGIVALEDATFVDTKTTGTGSAGDITISGTGLDGLSVTSNIDDGIDQNSDRLSPAAKVRITSRTQLEDSGSAGSIVIDGHGGTIGLENTEVSATTASDVIGNTPASIQLTSDGGEISLVLSEVNADTIGASNAGSITLSAETVSLDVGTSLRSETRGEGDAGSITVFGTELVTSNLVGAESGFFTEILSRSTTPDTGQPAEGTGRAGAVTIRGGEILFDNTLVLVTTQSTNPGNTAASVLLDAQGNDLTLNNFTSVQTSTTGASDAGSITLLADDIFLNNSGLASVSTSSGSAGDISLAGINVAMNSNVEISASAMGIGSAGSIDIVGLDSVMANTDPDSGPNRNLAPNRVLSSSDTTESGSAGSISIESKSIELTGTTVSATTASDVTTNTPALIKIVSDGGEIALTASTITDSTQGKSDAGSIALAAADVSIDESTISSSSNSTNANSIVVLNIGTETGAAGSVSIDGTNSVTLTQATIAADTSSPVVNAPGTLSIVTQGDLVVANSNLTTTTAGASSAGAINFQGSDVRLVGSRISSSNKVGNSGSAGQITIVGVGDVVLTANTVVNSNTESYLITDTPATVEVIAEGSLSILDRSGFNASTTGASDAGDIILQGANVVLDDSFANSVSNPTVCGLGIICTSFTGAAGSISIDGTESASLVNNSGLSTQTSSDRLENAPGVISIMTEGSLSLSNSELLASTFGGSDAGDINLHGEAISLDRSNITSESRFGGRIGLPDTTETGAAGEVLIKGESIDIDDARIAATTQSNRAGNEAAWIVITADPGDLRISSSELATSTSGASDAGLIVLTADNVFLTDKTSLTTETSGSGDAGDIKVSTLGSTVTLDGASMIAQSTGEGAAGGITIDAGTLLLLNGSVISSQANELGSAGSIDINLDDSLMISGNPDSVSEITTNAKQSQGGDITLTVLGPLSILNGLVEASAGAAGNGGDVTVEAEEVLMQNSAILARADAGNGGLINLTVTGTEQLFIVDSQSVISADSDEGESGDVNINAADVDLDSALQEQDANIVVAVELAADACSPNASGELSTFVQADEGGTPLAPDRYLTADAQTVISEVAAGPPEAPDVSASSLLAAVQSEPGEACR